MALDPNQLADALVTVFEIGMTATDSAEVAQALAGAIHAYVSAATVDGIAVEVVDGGGNPLGTGTQSAPVTIT